MMSPFKRRVPTILSPIICEDGEGGEKAKSAERSARSSSGGKEGDRRFVKVELGGEMVHRENRNRETGETGARTSRIREGELVSGHRVSNNIGHHSFHKI